MGTYKGVDRIINIERSLRGKTRVRQRVGEPGVFIEPVALGSRTLAGHLRAFMLYRGRRIAGRRG
jgi:hypothetical protein